MKIAIIVISVFVSLIVAADLQGENNTASPDAIGQSLEQAQELFEQGRLKEARAAFEQILTALRSSQNQRMLGSVLNALSLVYSDDGEYVKALQAAREAMDIRRQLGDRTGEARSTSNAGLALLYLGDYPGSIQYFKSALDLHRAGQELEDQVIVLNNFGNALYFQGRYLEALEQYQSAMDIVNKAKREVWGRHELQRTTANMAVLFQKLGRYDLALDLYSGLRAAPDVLTPSENARMLANLGSLYRHLGDPIKALETYRTAQNLFRLQRHNDGELGVLKNVGIAQASDLGNYAGALESFRQVLALAEKTSNRREAAQAHLYSAETLRRMPRLEEARDEFQQALLGSRELGAVEEQWKALYGLGRVAGESGDSDAAFTCFQQAIELIESLRSRIRLTSLRSDFLADKRDVYDALIAILLHRIGSSESRGDSPPRHRGAMEEIHRAIERGKARSFRDRWNDALDSASTRGNPILATELRELKAKMSLVWMRQLRSDAAKIEALRSESAFLESKYLEVERLLAASTQTALFIPEVPLESIQSALPENVALVEIWSGLKTLALLWVTRTDAGILRESLTPAASEQMRICGDSMANKERTDWYRPCQDTAALFLKDLLPRIGPKIKTLIFVPDEHSSFLPMEALPIPGERRLLLEHFNVFYLPSASMISRSAYQWSLFSKMPWSSVLIAFGDPWVGDRARAQFAALSMDPEISPLPYSREEVTSIARLMRGSSRLLLGRDALKRHFLELQPGKFRVVHLSTHAAIDSENPQRSRIVFSPETESGTMSYLFLGEIFNMDLRDLDLVTLSACDTALGKMVRGEGPQDFNRAFLTMGTRSTVASLWRIADLPSAEFMKQFYYFLAEGYPKAEALRQAKLKFMQAGSPLSHPYYWAAFILSGDGLAPLSMPISWGSFLFICGAFTILACVSVALVLQKLRA